MKLTQRWIATAGLAVAGLAASPAARALVTLEDGRDKIFVNGSVGIAYDSNVFSNSSSGGSMTYTATVGLEYVRRAGWIGVNASVVWTFTEYGSYPGQNFADPAFQAEFDKESGRTTGALTLGAQKQNRADVDVNTIDSSWAYVAGLTARYPVIDRYSISGSFNYAYTDYADQKLFTNLSQYSASLQLYYILSEERDVFAGYRYRYSESSGVAHDVDHSAFAGVSGRILPGLNGSLQAGYEVRLPYEHDTTHGGTTGGYTLAGSATWDFNRKSSLTGTISKDFGTTATATSIDTLTGQLTYTYAYSAKLSVFAGVGGGETTFFGDLGRIYPGGPERQDYTFNYNVGVNYTLNQHFKASLEYIYMRNWSNLSIADFPRDTTTLTLTSRW
jgi:hypothetical protein